MLKVINHSLVFLLELIMLGAFAYFGFHKANTSLAKYALAIALPMLAILIWSYWAAPKSQHRLPMPYLAILRLSLFFLSSYLLYRCGLGKFALIVALASAVTQIASFFTEGDK